MWSLIVERENTLGESPSTQSIEAQRVKLVRQAAKIYKPLLKPPSALEKVVGKPGAVKDRYFTAGSNVNEDNQRNIHTEKSPFKYPQDMEAFSYKVMSRAWREKRNRAEIKLKYTERQSHRTRQKNDLLNRLWVKEPQAKSMKTILNLDPDYFTVIEGRPVPQKLTHHEYIQNARDILKTKIVIGYRQDEILLIEEKFIVEQRIMDQVKMEFQKYVNTFEEFLFTDHTISMALLRQSEEHCQDAYEQYDIYRELSKKYGAIKSTVYNLEEKWRHCKMYQKFLYLMSPMEWRKQFDFYHIKKHSSKNSVHLEEEQSETSVFGRFKLALSGEVLSLDSLITQFLDDIRMQEEPELFFTEPLQLLKVFGYIELQNLSTLLHSEELAIPLENVKLEMVRTEKKFNRSMNYLQDEIDSLEGGIIWEEERAIYLEELALELINGEFKGLISNDEVINMYVFVEDLYEARIAVNDSNLSIRDMMKRVEINYREFLLQLDRLPADLVYHAEMHCYIEEARIMAVAEEAAKKVVQVERLMKNLARLLEPPTVKHERELKWRSAPRDRKKRPPPPPKPLTQEEIEYLMYFVNSSEISYEKAVATASSDKHELHKKIGGKK